MSHLEKKAKTIKDFYQDCICQIISKGKHPKKFDEQQKWVPLEDAQRMFVDNEALFEAAYKKITNLELKIAMANAIIQDAVKEARKTPQPQDMKTRLTFEFGKFEQLKNALQFTSNRPQEAKE